MRWLSWMLVAALAASAAVAGCDSHVPPEELPRKPPPVGGDRLEPNPPPIVPPDKRRDDSSSPVVFDRERGGVWTANGDVGSISYVDVDQGKSVAEVPVGKDITGVALSPDA